MRRMVITLFVSLVFGMVWGQTQGTPMPAVKRNSVVVVSELPVDRNPAPMKVFPEPMRFGTEGASGYRSLPKNFIDVNGIRVAPGTEVIQTGQGPNITGSVPPDPNCAVGPNHLVAVINTHFQIYNKSDGSTAQGITSFGTFFASEISAAGYGGNPTFDPKCLYDPFADRYVMLIIAQSSAGSRSHYFIAFSQTNDPTGAWNNYQVANNLDNTSNWLDYPSIGVDDTWLVVTGNMFLFNGGGFQYAKVNVFDKANGYAGLTLAPAEFANFTDAQSRGPFTLQPCNERVSAPDFYMLSTFAGPGNDVISWKISGTLPTLNLEDEIIPTDLFTTGQANPQLGSSGLTQIVGGRLFNAVRDGNKLFAARSDGTNTGTGAWARVFEVTLDDLGSTCDSVTIGGDDVYYSFPVVQTTQDGTLIVGGSRHSSTIYPSCFVIARHADGTWEPEIITKDGEAPYSDFSGNPYRFGDYSGISWDSSNPEDVWVLTEYSGPAGGSTNYRTQWAQVRGSSTAVPRLSVNQITALDEGDCGAVGGNVINLGEQVRIQLTLANSGAAEAQNVSVDVTTATGVTFDWDESTLVVGTVAASSTQQVEFVGTLTAANSCPEQTSVMFDVKLDGVSDFEANLDVVLQAEAVVEVGFLEDAESGGQLETGSALNLDDWGIVADPYSGNGTNVWFATAPEDWADWFVMTNWLNVGAGNTLVEFDIAYQLEADAQSNWDGAVIEIRTENGDWVDIGAIATGAPYDGPLFGNGPLGTRNAWTGDQASWRTCLIDLGSTYNGQKVQLRWRLACDGAATAAGTPGLAIDNIDISNVSWVSDYICDNTVCESCYASLAVAIDSVLTAGEWPDQKSILDILNICP